MKKSTLAICSLAVLSILGSCNKQNDLPATTEKVPQLQTITSPVLTYYTFGIDITEDDIVKNSYDPKELEYNYVEYAMTLCLLELYNHPALLADLVTKTNSTRNKCYNVFTFADKNPGVDAIFNAVFRARFSDFTTYSSNWRTYIGAKYAFEGVNYIPFARFANRGNIDLQQHVYIAAPFEINEEKFAGFKNNIPLWLKSGSTINFSTLNESTAKLITNPTLLISNGKNGDQVADYDIFPSVNNNNTLVNCLLPVHTHEYLTHTKFKINMSYEGTGSSEYKFLWGSTAAYKPDVPDWYGYAKYANQQKEVERNEVGTLIDFAFDVYSPDFYPNENGLCFDINAMTTGVYNHFAVAAIEYDWYAGEKEVFVIRNTAQTDWTVARDRRKFDHEWYYLDAYNNNSYPFNVRNPTQHSTYVNNTKGELRLHRWN